MAPSTLAPSSGSFSSGGVKFLSVPFKNSFHSVGTARSPGFPFVVHSPSFTTLKSPKVPYQSAGTRRHSLPQRREGGGVNYGILSTKSRVALPALVLLAFGTRPFSPVATEHLSASLQCQYPPSTITAESAGRVSRCCRITSCLEPLLDEPK